MLGYEVGHRWQVGMVEFHEAPANLIGKQEGVTEPSPLDDFTFWLPVGSLHLCYCKGYCGRSALILDTGSYSCIGREKVPVERRIGSSAGDIGHTATLSRCLV